MCFPWHAYTLLVEPVYCHWRFAHSTLRLNQERSKVSHQGHAHCLVPESLMYQSQGTFSALWPSKDSPDWQTSTRSALKGFILQNSSFVPTISLTTLYFINIANYKNNLTELEKLRIHTLLLKMSRTSAEQPVW